MAQLPSLAKASRRLFDAYRERRLAQMDATLRASASFDDQPALAIAAVELAARKKKVTAKFDSVALCASTNVTLGTYRTTYDQVMSVCFPQWFAAEQQSKLDATADRQKRAAKEAARDPETKRKFDDDYEDWRERVTARSKDRNAGANDAVAAPRKQTTLSSFVRRDDDGQESVVPSVATDRNEIDDSD
jgi:hypothetical protein